MLCAVYEMREEWDCGGLCAWEVRLCAWENEWEGDVFACCLVTITKQGLVRLTDNFLKRVFLFVLEGSSSCSQGSSVLEEGVVGETCCLEDATQGIRVAQLGLEAYTSCNNKEYGCIGGIRGNVVALAPLEQTSEKKLAASGCGFGPSLFLELGLGLGKLGRGEG